MFKCKLCPEKSFKTRAAHATHAAFRHGKRRTGRKDPEQVVHLRDVKKRSWRQIAETLHVPLTSLKMSGTVRGELTQIISGLKAEQALIADKISALEGALKYFQQ